MKRRNADSGKLRRPAKRGKITEGFYGSTFVYVKFLMVWAAVLMADFILEFRFEYLWPLWLLIRSVYDSFKYQGLAFSVFFVCIAVTSDIVCYLFIPVQWLFFAASTYVWVQYVWHTDRGICLPTVSLWLLFVYIEASIRLREFKNFPFNLDLCRPFAAHCIGYPVVTLGFGFKSYVSYKFRLQALPIEQRNLEKQRALAALANKETISNTSASPTTTTTTVHNGAPPHTVLDNSTTSPNTATTDTKKCTTTTTMNTSKSNSIGADTAPPSNYSQKQKELKQKQQQDNKQNNSSNTNSQNTDGIDYIENHLPPPATKRHNVNDFRGDHHNETVIENERNASSSRVLHKQQNGLGGGKQAKLITTNKDMNSSQTSSSKKGKNNNATTAAAPVYANNKDEVISRLEADVKRHRADLQGARGVEQELRSQINGLVIGHSNTKEELAKLREDNENLQNRLHKLVTGRQQDKENVGALERKLIDEKKQKAQFEQQLSAEKKAKKEQEAVAVASALANATRTECTDKCKLHVRELETDMKQSLRETQLRDEQIQQLERETQMLRNYKDSKNENDLLMSALGAMQEKNAHLENSLSAENRLKQDLFSALGEAKRQIEIQQGLLAQKEHTIANLKGKVAEVMALLPTSGFRPMVISSCADPPLTFSGSYTPPSTGSHTPPQGGNFTPPLPPPPQSQPMAGGEEDVVASSSLNPMASDYTPNSQH